MAPIPKLALDFAFGRGFLTARDVALAPFLTIDLIQVEIPDLRFPFRVGEGNERFKATRGLVRSLHLRVHAPALQTTLQQALQAHPEFHDVRIVANSRGLWLDVAVRAFSGHGRILCSLGVWADTSSAQPTLHVVPLEYWCSGLLPLTPGLHIARLLQAIIDATREAFTPTALCPSLIDQHLVLDLPALVAAAWFLPHGWKIPGVELLDIDTVVARDSELLVRASTPSDPRLARLAEAEDPGPGALSLLSPHAWARLQDVHEAQIRNALQLGDLEAAWASLPSAEQQNCDTPFAIDLALALSSPAALAAARRSINERLRENQHDIRALLHRARLASIDARPELALENLEKAVACCSPEHAPEVAEFLLMALADAQSSRAPDAALRTVTRLLRHNPRHEPAARMKAELGNRLGDLDAVEDAHRRLLAVAGARQERSRLHLELARLLESRRNDDTEALLHLEKAREHDPANADIVLHIAHIRLRDGRFAEAVQAFVQSAELRRTTRPALAAEALQRAAEIWLNELQDPREAMALIRRAVTLDPENLQVAILGARAATAARVYDQALQWLDHATTRAELLWAQTAQPGPLRVLHDAWLARADLDERRQRPDQALEHRFHALSLAPDDRRTAQAIERLLLQLDQRARLADFLADRAAVETDPTERQRIAQLRNRLLQGETDDTALPPDQQPAGPQGYNLLIRLADEAWDNDQLSQAIDWYQQANALQFDERSMQRIDAGLRRIAALQQREAQRISVQATAEPQGSPALSQVRRQLEKANALWQRSNQFRAASEDEAVQHAEALLRELALQPSDAVADDPDELPIALDESPHAAPAMVPPTDPVAWQDALRALEEARRKLDYPRICDLLLWLADHEVQHRDAAERIADAAMVTYYDLENDHDALSLLDLAIQRDSAILDRRFDVLSTWEDLCAAAGRFDALLLIYDRRIASAADPGLANVHRLLKAELIVTFLKRPNEALLEIDRALQLDPANTTAQRRRAEYLLLANDPPAALLAYTRLLRNPGLDAVEKPAIQLDYARAAEQFAENPQAVEAWRGVLALEPAHGEALSALRRRLAATTMGTDRLALNAWELNLMPGIQVHVADLDAWTAQAWGSLPEVLQQHAATLLLDTALTARTNRLAAATTLTPLALLARTLQPWDPALGESIASELEALGDPAAAADLWEQLAGEYFDDQDATRARQRAHDLRRCTASPSVPVVDRAALAEPAASPTQPALTRPATPPLRGRDELHKLAAIPSAAPAGRAVVTLDVDRELQAMDALVERGQFDAAIVSLNRVLRDVRQPELRMSLLLRKGHWLNERSRYSDALQPLKGAFIYDPENPALLLELARASAGAGNTRDANQYLHQAMHGPRSSEITEQIRGFQLPVPADVTCDDE